MLKSKPNPRDKKTSYKAPANPLPYESRRIGKNFYEIKITPPDSDASREAMYRESLRLRSLGDPVSYAHGLKLQEATLASLWKDRPFRAARAWLYGRVRWMWPLVVAVAKASFFFDFEIRPKVDLEEGGGRAGVSKRILPFTVESD